MARVGPAVLVLAAVVASAATPASAETTALKKLVVSAPSEQWAAFVGAWPTAEKPKLSVRVDGRFAGSMRLHGSRSSRRSARKASFRLQWGTRGAEPEHRVVLKSGFFDETRLREWLGLRMFGEAGITAPPAELVELWRDDEPLGVYLAITAIDADYVFRSGIADAEQALLYWGDPPGSPTALKPDLVPAAAGQRYPDAYTPVLTRADPEHHSLDGMLRALNAEPLDLPFLSQTVDLEQWAQWFAVSEIMENWDSPWHRRGNNYSLYRRPSGRWQILPWDVDHIYERKSLYFPRPLVAGVEKLHADEQFQLELRARVQQLLAGALNPVTLGGWLNDAKRLIGPSIEAGREPELQFETWTLAVRQLQREILARAGTLSKLVCDTAALGPPSTGTVLGTLRQRPVCPP